MCTKSHLAMRGIRKRKVGCGRCRANRYIWSRSRSGGYLQKSGEMTDPKEKRSVKGRILIEGDIRCVENRELSLSASEPATQKEVRN